MIPDESFREIDRPEQILGVGLPAEPCSDEPASTPTLRLVFRQEGGFVLRVLRRMGVPEGDLDDAAQDVFCVVYRKLSEFDVRGSLKGWLFGIANRVALARRRRAHVRHEEPHADLDFVADVEGPTDLVGPIDARALLLRALEKLDDDKRAAFVLYELEGLSIQEVADAVGCPFQTAYSRLRAARELVRSDVERATRSRTP